MLQLCTAVVVFVVIVVIVVVVISTAAMIKTIDIRSMESLG
jgi:hypothetical protein